MMMMMMMMIPLLSLGVSVSRDFTSVLKICTHGSPVSIWTTWWMIWFLVSLVERRPVATQLHERQSLVFSFFARDIPNKHRWADLCQIFQEDCKWVAIQKLSFWFMNSFEGGRVFKKVTFASEPASQNANWRQNWSTYWKNKVFLAG